MCFMRALKLCYPKKLPCGHEMGERDKRPCTKTRIRITISFKLLNLSLFFFIPKFMCMTSRLHQINICALALIFCCPQDDETETGRIGSSGVVTNPESVPKTGEERTPARRPNEEAIPMEGRQVDTDEGVGCRRDGGSGRGGGSSDNHHHPEGGRTLRSAEAGEEEVKKHGEEEEEAASNIKEFYDILERVGGEGEEEPGRPRHGCRGDADGTHSLYRFLARGVEEQEEHEVQRSNSSAGGCARLFHRQFTGHDGVLSRSIDEQEAQARVRRASVNRNTHPLYRILEERAEEGGYGEDDYYHRGR